MFMLVQYAVTLPIQVLYTLLEDHSVYMLGVDAKNVSMLVLITYYIINILISHLL